MAWLWHLLGLDNVSGTPYAFWSGFAGDVTVISAIVVWLRRAARHHRERLAQAARHHREQLQQQSDHHAEMKVMHERHHRRQLDAIHGSKEGMKIDG